MLFLINYTRFREGRFESEKLRKCAFMKYTFLSGALAMSSKIYRYSGIVPFPVQLEIAAGATNAFFFFLTRRLLQVLPKKLQFFQLEYNERHLETWQVCKLGFFPAYS